MDVESPPLLLPCDQSRELTLELMSFGLVPVPWPGLSVGPWCEYSDVDWVWSGSSLGDGGGEGAGGDLRAPLLLFGPRACVACSVLWDLVTLESCY